jgi:hypothetical protein
MHQTVPSFTIESHRISVPASLAWLAPLSVDGLIRVGGPNDGGYVILEHLLHQADILISMGLGANWQFEKDARALNSRLRIHVYDHTVSERLFLKQYLIDCAGAFTLSVGLSTVRRRWRRLNDYRRFFGHGATHFRQRVYDRTDEGSVDIATIFERAGPGNVFVKMDIEGSEYRVLDDVMLHADRVLGFAIEFHDTGPLRPVFERCMATVLQRFEIVHMHANNFAGPYRDGLPEALEISLARKDLVSALPRRTELPLAGLDQPNDPRRPDYHLTFA